MSLIFPGWYSLASTYTYFHGEHADFKIQEEEAEGEIGKG